MNNIIYVEVIDLRGDSHLNMNVTTGAVVAETCFLILHTESPEWLKTGISAFKDFMLDNGDIPIVFFTAVSILLYLIGGLLPDIDTPYSTLGKIIHIPVEHRTWTHAVWWIAVLCIAGIWWRMLFWLGLGVFVHDLWDSFSASGLNWFYPIKKKNKHRIKLYHTGKRSEYIIVGVAWTLTVIYAVVIVQIVYNIVDISL